MIFIINAVYWYAFILRFFLFLLPTAHRQQSSHLSSPKQPTVGKTSTKHGTFFTRQQRLTKQTSSQNFFLRLAWRRLQSWSLRCHKIYKTWFNFLNRFQRESLELPFRWIESTQDASMVIDLHHSYKHLWSLYIITHKLSHVASMSSCFDLHLFHCKYENFTMNWDSEIGRYACMTRWLFFSFALGFCFILTDWMLSKPLTYTLIWFQYVFPLHYRSFGSRKYYLSHRTYT